MQTYNRTLTARVTGDELNTLTKQARAMDRTRSEYLRGVIKALQERQDLRREIQKLMEVRG
jgi:hypothetical protein